MMVRRVVFAEQFMAALVLPIWVLIAHGTMQDGVGWDLVLYLVLCPVLCVVMLAVSGLVCARRSVRTARAVSWQDAVVLLAWQAAILAYGFVTSPALATVVVLLGVVAFWSAAWQLFDETRTRVKNAFSLEPVDSGTYRAVPYDPATDPGRVIIVNPDGTREHPPRR